MDIDKILQELRDYREELVKPWNEAIAHLEAVKEIRQLSVAQVMDNATAKQDKSQRANRKRTRKSAKKQQQASVRAQQKLQNKREILVFIAEQGGDSALPTTMIRNRFADSIAESTMTRYLRELVDSGDLVTFEQDRKYYYRIPIEPTELVREAQEEIRLNVTTHRPLTEDEQRALGNGVISVAHSTTSGHQIP